MARRRFHSDSRTVTASEWCGLLALLVVCLAPVAASTLGVQNVNKNSGTFAAQVGVASACTGELHEEVTGIVNGDDFAGCSTLTSDADLASGTTTFTAGDLVILRDGFHVTTGATLTVEIDRALYPDAWVQDDTPDGETVYSARFYIDASDLNLSSDSHRFYQFLAFDAAGDPELRVGVKRVGTERHLFLEAFEDDGGFQTTEGNEINLESGWHWVEVGWESGSPGRAFICRDVLLADMPTGCIELGNLDNDTGAIDFVRWGAVDVPSNTPTGLGNVELDDFESRSSLHIGELQSP
jgi:hypothetical protein